MENFLLELPEFQRNLYFDAVTSLNSLQTKFQTVLLKVPFNPEEASSVINSSTEEIIEELGNDWFFRYKHILPIELIEILQQKLDDISEIKSQINTKIHNQLNLALSMYSFIK